MDAAEFFDAAFWISGRKALLKKSGAIQLVSKASLISSGVTTYTELRSIVFRYAEH